MTIGTISNVKTNMAIEISPIVTNHSGFIESNPNTQLTKKTLAYIPANENIESILRQALSQLGYAKTPGYPGSFYQNLSS